MAVIILSLLIIPLLGCIFSLSAKKNDNNAFYVCAFTLLSNMATVLYLLSKVNEFQTELVYRFNWLNNSSAEITLGIDLPSMLLLLGIYLAAFIGLTGLNYAQQKSKLLMLLTLYFLWNVTGLILAKDMISFYVFFAGMLLPTFLLLCVFGNVKKSAMLYLFFIFNFAGILSLLIAVVFSYKFYHGNVLLKDISLTAMPLRVCFSIFWGASLAFITRIPIWPLHYWISSINSSIKNPVAYITTSILPLTGVWGFMCFWSINVPTNIKTTVPLVLICGLLTMEFIAFIGLAHRDFIRKLFSYSTTYYLFFLLAIILLGQKYKITMVYSLFIFLLVHASLVVLDLIINRICEEKKCDYRGILFHIPRLSRLFIFFVLIAAGLPISSMFWNNFVLISALFRRSFIAGIGCISAITLVGLSLLYELYIMYDLKYFTENVEEIEDISERKQAVLMMIIVILFLSFFNPLWFVF